MIYVFDNTPFSALFKSFYRSRFPTLWERYDALIQAERLTSTREVLQEIEDGACRELREWAAGNPEIFSTPVAAEGAFVAQIYSIAHFQQNIEQKKLLRGGRNADPFVIAKAATIGGTVVTLELFKENGVKIPNICRHFEVHCITLEEFMEAENWTF
jgi:hypothetical protein